MTDNIIGCDRLDELLPDHLEGTLDAGTRMDVETHLVGCQRCASLIADLNVITEAAGDLPDLSPSKDLWAGISERIAAPVLALPTERERRATRHQRLRTVAGAAALVVMTATLTFVGTKFFIEARSATQARTVASDPGAPLAAAASEVAPDTTPSSAAPVPTPEPPPAAAVTAPRIRPPVAEPRNVGRTAAERTYDREINQLQALLRERRGELDAKTVQVIERNLRVIDDAIRQSREALQRDPASRFLNDQLNNALDRKVELLRSAAMLPSST